MVGLQEGSLGLGSKKQKNPDGPMLVDDNAIHFLSHRFTRMYPRTSYTFEVLADPALLSSSPLCSTLLHPAPRCSAMLRYAPRHLRVAFASELAFGVV